MKRIDLHTEAREYVLNNIVPETEEGTEIDMVKHLQYFALLMIKKAEPEPKIPTVTVGAWRNLRTK